MTAAFVVLLACVVLLYVLGRGPRIDWFQVAVAIFVMPPALVFLGVAAVYQRIPLVPKTEGMRVDNALRSLRRELRGAGASVVQTRDSGQVCFLICRTQAEALQLGARRDELFERFRQHLRRCGIDTDVRALSYLSREEIDRGGGDFHYWRERGNS